MKNISCVSEEFDNEVSYCIYKAKISMRVMFPFVLGFIVLLVLAGINTHKWDNILIYSSYVLGAYFIMLSLRFCYFDRKYFKTRILYNEDVVVFIRSPGDVHYESPMDKIGNVIFYSNIILIEWKMKYYPWVIYIRIEDIDKRINNFEIEDLKKCLLKKCTNIKDFRNKKIPIF